MLKVSVNLLKIVCGLLAIGFSFLLLGKTPWLAIDQKSCKPVGAIGVARSVLQPTSFIKDQAQAIDERIQLIKENIVRERKSMVQPGPNMEAHILVAQAIARASVPPDTSLAAPYEAQAEQLNAMANDIRLAELTSKIIESQLKELVDWDTCKQLIAK